MIEFKQERRDWAENLISEISIKLLEDEDLGEVVQQFRSFLLAIGYQPVIIDKYIEAE